MQFTVPRGVAPRGRVVRKLRAQGSSRRDRTVAARAMLAKDDVLGPAL